MKLDTVIGIVLDRSGSMASRKGDTIGGFNELLTKQIAEPGVAAMTLAQFDNEYEVLADMLPLAEVNPLTGETYIPRGGTALRDALGVTINGIGEKLAAMPEEDRPSKVIIAVLSDGHENASREFAPEALKTMIVHQQEKYGWEFIFMGCNQDAVEAARGYGISTRNAYNYSSSPIAARAAFSALSDDVALCRSEGKTRGKGGDGSEVIGASTSGTGGPN